MAERIAARTAGVQLISDNIPVSTKPPTITTTWTPKQSPQCEPTAPAHAHAAHKRVSGTLKFQLQARQDFEVFLPTANVLGVWLAKIRARENRDFRWAVEICGQQGTPSPLDKGTGDTTSFTWSNLGTSSGTRVTISRGYNSGAGLWFLDLQGNVSLDCSLPCCYSFTKGNDTNSY